MRVFLRRIPPDTKSEELRRFFEPIVSARWHHPFRVVGSIVGSKLVEIRAVDGDDMEFHGLVDIEPREAAERAILSGNGRKLRGQVIEVRRWFDRSGDNDHRRMASAQTQPRAIERRRADRRRAGLEVRVLESK